MEGSFCPLRFQLLKATHDLVFKLEANDLKKIMKTQLFSLLTKSFSNLVFLIFISGHYNLTLITDIPSFMSFQKNLFDSLSCVLAQAQFHLFDECVYLSR